MVATEPARAAKRARNSSARGFGMTVMALEYVVESFFEQHVDGLGETELASIRFARDFTLHAHTITRERLRELRRAGLSDGAILDLAYVCAVFNGLARLVIALAPV